MGIKTFDRANPAVKQIEVYSEFTGGLNTEQSDMTMRDNEFRELVNFDFDFAGSLTKRPGLRKVSKVKDYIVAAFRREYPDPQDWLDIEILDSVNFFDGLNWVFNYVTNKGLGVAILSKNMEVILDAYTGEVFEPEKNFIFYSNIKNNIKISAYSDYWVMITSDYTPAPPVPDPTNKQVRIYSWNPIPNLTYFPVGETISKTIDKSWVEGGLTATDTINETFYGKSETVTIPSSGKLDRIENNNVRVNVTPAAPSPNKFLYNFLSYFKMSIKYNPDDVSLDLIWTHPGETDVRKHSIPLKFAGWNRSDNQILQMSILPYPSYDSVYCMFYQPNTNSIMRVSLPTSRTFFDITKITVVVKTKDALKKLKNINNYTQRAEEFLQTDAGVPYDFTYGDLITPDGSKSVITTVGGLNSGTMKHPIFKKQPNQEIIKWDDTSVIGIASNTSNTSTLLSGYDATNRWTLAKANNDTLDVIQSNKYVSDDVSSVNFVQNTTVSSFKFAAAVDLNGEIATPFWYEYSVSQTGGAPTLKFLYYAIETLRSDEPMYSKYYFTSKTSTSLMYPFYRMEPQWGSVSLMSGKNSENKTWSGNDRDKVMFFDICGFNYDKVTRYSLRHQYSKETNSVGFAFASGEALLSFGDYNVTIPNFYFSGLMDNNLIIHDPNNISNITDLLILNNRVDLVEKLRVSMLWSEFLGKKAMDEIDQVFVFLQQGKILKINLRFSYLNALGEPQVVSSFLRANVLFDILDAINLDPTLMLNIYEFSDQSGSLYGFKLTTTIKGEEITVFDVSEYSEIPVSDYESLISSIVFNFVYVYFPEGEISNVVQFKRLLYQKPNLNDLAYLWYNFALFNKYVDQTKPDIYDTENYKVLSKELIQYPINESVLNPVQLYGIVPVNDLILAPGKDQNFQVFAQFAAATLLSDILVVVSAMPLSDYTTRQQSKDFDTQKSLTWKPWGEIFPDYILGPDNPAVLKLSIPSTTSPYLIVIQAGKALEPDKEGKIFVDTATVVETRIEMSPQSNIVERVDIPTLFDEYTASNQMKMFETSSALVIYGNSNKIFFSDIAVPGYFPISRVIQLQTPQAIKSTSMFQNKLIVSTENTRWYIGGTSFDSDDASQRHSVNLISSNSGIISTKTEVPFGDKLYFIDANGISYIKNLYGTSDKEFTTEQADKKIKSIVPIYDKDACSISFNQKLYINFPSESITLVYDKNYDAWLMYESPFMSFANFFTNDGKLYAVGKNDFEIYVFDKDVLVDGWTEDDGYTVYQAPDGTKHNVQNGKPIVCRMQTKELDQNYVPHRKKYNQALINATITGTNGTITPTIKIDSEEINYNFEFIEDASNTLHFQELDKQGINLINSPNMNYNKEISNDDVSLSNVVIGQSQLGETKNVYYNIPIQRTGNSVSFAFTFDAPSIIVINSLTIRYSLRLPKKHRGGR